MPCGWTSRVLVITDVGLPGGMNGRQLANLASAWDHITGYGGNAAIEPGRLERGTDVMTKPFSMSALAAKVRTIADPHV